MTKHEDCFQALTTLTLRAFHTCLLAHLTHLLVVHLYRRIPN